jgi:hypothetical protein
MPIEQRPNHFRTSFDEAADDYDAVTKSYLAVLYLARK